MARMTYENTIARFNSCDLRQALALVSLLSAIEFEGGSSLPVLSLLNSEKVRLLADAILQSKAAWYKNSLIGPNDLPTLLNGANEALEDERLYQEVVSGGERQEMLYKLQRYLSRLAYIQIRPQQPSFIPLGRTLAILEVIPQKSLAELPPQLQNEVSLLPSRVAKVLGLSVGEIVRMHLSLQAYFGILGQLFLRKYIPQEGRLSVRQQGERLANLIANCTNDLRFFRLDSSAGKIVGQDIAEALGDYANVFGRSITVHRQLLGRAEFKVGPRSHRLSPLDRFPLIAEKEGRAWYAPNIRGLICSAPDVIHFTLNELFREPYESVRGVLLEAYLRLMLRRRAPNLVVIQEKRWPSPKGGVDGPDLLIIDHSKDPAVFAIEVKSRRMVIGTRYELLDEHLVQNYADLWKALKQLASKVEKIFTLAGDYQQHKDDLIRAMNYPVYYVGLAGEVPYLFGELTEYRRLRDSEFPLYGLEGRFGVMSVDVFERMLEVSIQQDRPLAGVFRGYLEDCSELELSSPMAENFRHVDLNEEESFGFAFLKPFWPGTG